MSGDFKVLYSSKDAFVQMYMTKMNSWVNQLNRLEEKMNAIAELESFQGEAATSVKSYISDVYPLILLGTRQAMYEFFTRVSLYSTGYYDIEDDIYAQINQETLDELKTEARNEKGNLTGESQSIQSLVNQISNLVWLKNPSQEYLQDALEDVASKSERLVQDVTDYEQNAVSGVDTNLAPLISALYATINEFLQNRGSITEYNAGDYGGKVAVHDLVEKLKGSIDYTAENADALDESLEKMNDVAVQKQKDYEEELERQKKDEGLAKAIKGAIITIGAAVIIVGTAGAATPVVVVASVSGGCMAAYGLSETAEGTQEFVTGKDGWNPIRDTVFAGNQDMYDAWGSINMTVAGLCVPVGKAVNSVAGASGSVVVKKVAVTVGKEIVTDAIVDSGTNVIVNYVDEKADLSATEKVILEQVVDKTLSKGIDVAVDGGTKMIKGHGDAEFTDKMTFDEAKRYNQYWADRASDAGEPGYEGFDVTKPDADVPTLDVKPEVDAPALDVKPEVDAPALDVKPQVDAPALDVKPQVDAPAPDAKPNVDATPVDTAAQETKPTSFADEMSAEESARYNDRLQGKEPSTPTDTVPGEIDAAIKRHEQGLDTGDAAYDVSKHYDNLTDKEVQNIWENDVNSEYSQESIDAAIEKNAQPDAYSDEAYNAEHYYDDLTAEDVKQLEDNDFGAVNNEVLDYEHPEYIQDGTLKVDWGSDAVGHTEVVDLPAGTRIIQYAHPDGSGYYFAPEGTEYADLQLPDVEGKRVMAVYEVQEGGLTVEKSEVAIQPWNRSESEYGGTGATQYKTDKKANESAAELVKRGILKPVDP